MGPGSPRGPCGPTAPGSPFGPMSPLTPWGPRGPCGPAIPRGPMGPGAPVSPLMPCSPWGPCSPRGPCGPWRPGDHLLLRERVGVAVFVIVVSITIHMSFLPRKRMRAARPRLRFPFGGGVIVIEPLTLRSKIESNDHREYRKKILTGDPIGDGQVSKDQGEQNGDNAFDAEQIAQTSEKQILSCLLLACPWIVEITEESRTAAILCLESGLGAWTGGERTAFPLFAGENKKTVCSCKIRTHCFFGTPGGTRTPNPQNRNLMRYPLRYWRIAILTCQVIIAGETGIVKENFDEFQKKLYMSF